MSNVSAISGSTTTTAAASTKDAEKASIDYDAFLQLLVAQLKNQDPTDPADPTEQLSQLASFSNVEQSIKVNQKLETMITLSSLTQADAVLGRKITSGDGTVTGTVKSVSVTDNGAVATLDSGAKLTLGSGIKIEQ